MIVITIDLGVHSHSSPFDVKVAFVQYKFKGQEEHSIDNPPHKNSKSLTPYKRTHPSTLKRMKEVAKHHKPSSAFEMIDAEMEKEECPGIGKLPHSKKQVSDIRKKLFVSKQTDDLAVMMERCKCVEPGEPEFVRAVQAAPQPLCVLATDLQLKQVQFCCTDQQCWGNALRNITRYVIFITFIELE